MNKVFVIDADGEPLLPIKMEAAQKLIERGKATVFRKEPLIIKRKTLASPSLREKASYTEAFLTVYKNSKVAGIEVDINCKTVYCIKTSREEEENLFLISEWLKDFSTCLLIGQIFWDVEREDEEPLPPKDTNKIIQFPSKQERELRKRVNDSEYQLELFI